MKQKFGTFWDLLNVSLLLALVVAIPFSLKYIVEEPFAISSLNVLSVALIAVTAVSVVLGRLRRTIPKDRSFWLMVGLFTLAVIWALLHTTPLRNGVGLITSRFGQPFLVGYSAYLLLSNAKLQVKHIVAACAATLVPLIVIGALQLAHVLPYADPGRVTALYIFPNTFARYVFLLLMIAMPWVLLVLRGRQRMFGLVLVTLGGLLLLSTKSYGGTVGAWTGSLLILTLLPREWRRFKTWGIAVLLIGAVIVALNAPRLPKWQTSITDSRLTRLEFWRVARGVIAEHPWTGIGIKGWETQYSENVRKFAPFPPLNWASPQPHNFFLDSLVKAGIPGLIGFTSFLVWPLIAGIQLARSTKDERWYGLILAGCALSLLTFGLIDDPIWSDDTMPLLWVLFWAGAWVMAKSKELPHAV